MNLRVILIAQMAYQSNYRFNVGRMMALPVRLFCDIFERVDMDRARVTRAVQRLQMRNLVSKLVNEEDRRLVCLALTDEGWEMASELSRIAIDFEQHLLSAAAIDDGILRSFDALEAALAT